MKKKFVSALSLCIALILASAALASCGADFDYDLTEYVTLPDYKSIKIDKSVMDQTVEQQIQSLLQNKATTEDVTDRGAENDDIVNIDYAGTMNGEPFEGGTSAGVDLTLGNAGYVEGFEAGIVGMKTGDKKTVNITFPEDYMNADIAGKEAAFEITLNSIKHKVIPEWNDEFVVSLENGFSTVDEFKAEIEKGVMENMAWEEIAGNTSVISYPKKEVKKYYDRMIQNYERMAASYGMTLSGYIAQNIQTDPDTFFSQVADAAKVSVKTEMIMTQIARNENIVLTDEMYEKNGEKLAEDFGAESLKDLEKAYGRKEVEHAALMEDVKAFILSCTTAE